MYRNLRTLILLTIIACLPVLACTDNAADAEIWIASYDTVWQTVNENHYDSTFGGVDWNEIRDRYRERVLKVDDDKDFVGMMNEMLMELKLSHYAVFQMDDKVESGSPMFSPGDVGIEIRLLDNQAVISKVAPDFPAAKAGLKPGYVIESIDSVPVAEMIEEAAADQVEHFNERNKLSEVADGIFERFFGDVGTSVTIEYLDESGAPFETTLTRQQRTGESVISEHLPALYVDFQAKRLEGNIGYVSFSAFVPPVDSLFDEAMNSMMDVKGLILDLRGNPGGMHEIGESIVSRMLREPTMFSVFKARTEVEEVVVEPRGEVFDGPVVVMIDVMNGSASERFSGCIQSIGRAVVIGEQSPGVVGPSDLKQLPNGASFMFLIAQSLTPDGTVLEGHGVVPDITVPLDREALLNGTDTQLERAVAWVESGR